MPLVLTVRTYQHSLPSERVCFIVEHDATIGRSKDNDWVLPDEKKYVSQYHARIEKRAADYFIIDTSQNGVFVNDKSVGRNNSHILEAGDRLGIGDYEIGVETTDARQTPAGPPQLPAGQPTELDDHPAAFEPLAIIENTPPLADDQVASQGPTPPPALHEAFTPPIPNDWKQAEPDSTSNTTEHGDVIPENWWIKESPGANTDLPSIRNTQPTVPPTDRPTGAHGSHNPARNVSHVDDDALSEFLAGAGREDIKEHMQQTPTPFRNAGVLLRAFTQGTMDALKARRHIKKEFRAGGLTMLGPKENNPLKFSLNVHEAIEQLLSPRGDGFLLPAQSIQEAFDDINSHQVAVMAGMQAALQLVLERFDPSSLERRLGKRALLDDLVPMHRKAKTWELFAEEYKEIAHEAEGDFNQVFLKEFGRAYDEHIEKLRVKHSQAIPRPPNDAELG